MNYIEVTHIIEESNSTLLKKMPGIILRLLERLIKQKEMNRILNKYSDIHGIDFLFKIIEELNLDIEVEGKENLPEDSKCFFISNHPFGVVDGLVLTSTVAEKYGTLKAIGNDAFMYIPNIQPLIAAVNVFGRNSKEHIKELDQIYSSNIPITHFPAGEVSRRYNGKIEDCEWHKSFITKAVSHQRNIVPFYFFGRNSRFFHSVYILRRMLGIKLNIELLLLPKEIFNKKNKTIKVKIGKPIPYNTLDTTFTHYEWAQKLRMHVYNMDNNNHHELVN